MVVAPHGLAVGSSIVATIATWRRARLNKELEEAGMTPWSGNLALTKVAPGMWRAAFKENWSAKDGAAVKPPKTYEAEIEELAIVTVLSVELAVLDEAGPSERETVDPDAAIEITVRTAGGRAFVMTARREDNPIRYVLDNLDSLLNELWAPTYRVRPMPFEEVSGQ